MNNLYLENTDLRFILNDTLNLDEVIHLKEKNFHYASEYKKNQNPLFEYAPTDVDEAKQYYDTILEQIGELCAKEIIPHIQEINKQKLKLTNGKVEFPRKILDITSLFVASGLHTYSLSREYGGLHIPLSIQIACLEMLAYTDMAFSMYIGSFNIPEILERFASEEIKKTYLPQICKGKLTGAMALTEPNYGSDLSSVMTKADKNDDNEYSLTGTKRYITHGCGVGEIPALILTLARSKGNGAKGLSFFVVNSNDVEVIGIENKVGIHLSPTCEIAYDNSKAVLVGEEGKGLIKYAMEMMNTARLGIAVQSIGVAYSAYMEAKKYASERSQFNTKIENLNPVKKLLNESNAIIQALRSLVYETAIIIDSYELQILNAREESSEKEKEVARTPEIKKMSRVAKTLTPVCKLVCSELANLVVNKSVQVFGGAGFIEDYKIAQIYRDVRITSIYEGTSQLQVIGAIGGIVSGMLNSGDILNLLDSYLDSISTLPIHKKLNIYKDNLIKHIEAYKQFTKDQKEMLAEEIVNYFAFLIMTCTLAKQIIYAQENNHSILAEKEAILSTFTIIAERNMKSCEVALNAIV